MSTWQKMYLNPGLSDSKAYAPHVFATLPFIAMTG